MEECSYTLEKGHFLSSDKTTQSVYYFYIPKREARAVVQLSHGMCEYVERYAPFAEFLSENGFILCGNDHLGHGNSAKSADDLGFTAEKGGAAYLVMDLHKMTGIIKQKYPELPVFLLGHSMGSFVVRLYMAKYPGELDGAIISGTGGPNPLCRLGKIMAAIQIKRHGERYRSETLKKIAFGSYNDRYTTDEGVYAWLSKDPAIREKYAKDPFCNYVFTARGFYDLFDLLDRVSDKKWAEEIPKNLPVFIISGAMDPVGAFGEGPKIVYKRLKDAGVKDVVLRLYDDDRHEILNETDKEKVYADILAFLDRVLGEN